MNKRGMDWVVAAIITTIVAVTLFLVVYSILQRKDTTMISLIKNLFRFRG